MKDHSYPVLLWPLLVYGIAVVSLVGGILLISYFLGERHKEHATEEAYEGGVVSTGTARLRFPVLFYIIAMFFVTFDVAAVYIISWAIAIRELGWTGYIMIFIFIGIVLVALTYICKIGAFDFGPDGKKILKAYNEKYKTKNSL
jgi:NADH-quinone oxidoreductase subunit A